jgi:Asp-tRNA(Asn)/Glu-tRNA(Gln) amidotransferase A subunit family amidase
MGAFHGHLLDGYREMLDPENVEMLERAAHIDAVAYKRIELVRTRIWRDLAQLFQRYDVLLFPTVPRTAPLATDSDRNYGYRDASGYTVATQMTAPFNLVPHCPALSVPSGVGECGLPTAAQIVGRRFDEATVLRVGRAIERTDPLKGVRPGVF